MYNVKTLNKIAACGTDLLDRSKYTVGDGYRQSAGNTRSFRFYARNGAWR